MVWNTKHDDSAFLCRERSPQVRERRNACDAFSRTKQKTFSVPKYNSPHNMSKVHSSHLDLTSFWSDREEVPETSDVHLSNMMMLRWKMLRVEDPHIPIPSDSRIERYLLMYPQIFRNVVESSRRVFSSTRVPVLECWCSMVFEMRNKI